MLRGKSPEAQQKDAEDRQFRRSLAQNNLQSAARTQDDGDAAEILRILSEIDDLPINAEEDEVLGQLVSRLSSTANLTPEQVTSNEWVAEYIMVLYLCKYPKPDGLHGAWRGVAHSDPAKALAPMDPDRRMMIESFVSQSKLALTRSEEAKVIEESSRTINESVVNDDSKKGKSGGIWGRIKG